MSLNGLPALISQQLTINEHDILQCISTYNSEESFFVHQLVTKNLASAKILAQIISVEFGLSLLDLSSFNMKDIDKNIISRKLIRKYRAIPLHRRGNRLFIGISDPSNLNIINDIQFHTGLTIETIVVEDDKLSEIIDRIADSTSNLLDGIQEDDNQQYDVETTNIDEEENEVVDDDEVPIIRFVNKVLIDAIQNGASDIHLEPYETRYRIRLRTDGILREFVSPPQYLASKIAARIKVMSKMDISERRIPQDGRIKIKYANKNSMDFRVNTLPTLWGEKIVLRLLDSSSAKMGIDSLGYEADQKQLFLEALQQPQGMILVTGPTGSGKTVSLYTGLNILNTEDKNISTVEDPVEINLEGINQVNVNNKVGLNFSMALRAFLRQDPDIVMVGEIRDLETAQIAIKASQTGHLVLSTLHTNSASETLTRLLNMGIPAFNIATSISLIIAQRLARTLCNHCKKPIQYTNQVLEEAGFVAEDLQTLNTYAAVGCSHCNDGYKGRTGIYEVVRITKNIAQIIMNEGNSLDLSNMSRSEGFNNLRSSALKKVAQGITSLEEINRVTID